MKNKHDNLPPLQFRNAHTSFFTPLTYIFAVKAKIPNQHSFLATQYERTQNIIWLLRPLLVTVSAKRIADCLGLLRGVERLKCHRN